MTTVNVDRAGIRDGFPADLNRSNRNGQRGRSVVMERLERALVHLAARRKLTIPGPWNKTVDFPAVATWGARVPREGHSPRARLVLLYSTAYIEDVVLISWSTPQGSGSVQAAGTGSAQSPEQYEVPLEWGAGDDSDFSQADISFTIAPFRGSGSDPSTPSVRIWHAYIYVEPLSSIEL